MGVPSVSFCKTHKNDVHNMKVNLLNYAKALRSQQSHPDLPFGIGDNQGKPKLVLPTTTTGYPILPLPLPSDKWNKKDWEDLFSMYIGRHYRKFHTTQ
jgi:hypothetical protein